MDRVRKYAVQMELNDAVERAITECIQDGILAFIQDKQEDGIAPEIILAKLQRAFSLTSEEAQNYLDTLVH